MRHRRRHLQGARQPVDLRRAAAAAAPRAGRRGHRHDAGHALLHAQGARHGARRLPHPQHALAARQRRPGPGALPDRRQRLQRRGGAALLRQRALRHRARAQRQPHQRAGAEGRAGADRPPPHQHRQRHRGADQRAGARTAIRRTRPAADAGGDLQGGGCRAPARQGFVCGDRTHRRLRAAGFSRPLRHPPAVFRRGAGAGPARGPLRHGGQRIGGAGRHRPPPDARRGARRGGLHRPRRPHPHAPMRAGAEALPLHVRVRLPGAARLGARRHLGLPGAAEPGRDAGAAPDLDDAAERHRRRDPDPRKQPAQRDAAGAPHRQALPRRVREEPLRRPHFHHAGAGRAQEERAPEAQRHRHGIQGPQRAAGRRLDRARHHQQGDRADGARGRRAPGLHGLGGAAGALPQRLRHRHADQGRADRARPQHRGDP